MKSGYTWRHLYTQCVLTRALLAFRHGVHVDEGFCEGRRGGKNPPQRGNGGEGGLAGDRGEESVKGQKVSDEEVVDVLVELIKSGFSA